MPINYKIQQFIKTLPLYLRIEFLLLMVVFMGIFSEAYFVYQLHDRTNILLQKKLEVQGMVKRLEKDSRKLSLSQKQRMLLVQDYIAYQKINNLTPENVIDKMSRIAKKSNLMIQSIQPVTQQKENDSEEYVLNIDAISNYKNFIEFMNALVTGSTSLPLLIKTLNVEKPIQTTVVTATQNLNSKIAFVFYKNTAKPLINLDTVLSKINSQNTMSMINTAESQIKSTAKLYFRDPFSIDDMKNHYPLGLDFWPIARLNLVGMVQQAKRGLAIIADPNDDIYKVIVGDKIGREQRIIVSLDKGEIILAKEKNKELSNSIVNIIHLVN